MSDMRQLACTAFERTTQKFAGKLLDLSIYVREAMDREPAGIWLVFDDATGKVVDLDLRGSSEDIERRLIERSDTPEEAMKPQGRGRPKLGVVAREITLLPRHWDWLAEQPGGASQALRRLIDEARGGQGDLGSRRMATERAYSFMSAMAGDLPHFEEASRALFAGDRDALAAQMRSWPRDVAAYVLRLLDGSAQPQ